LLWGQLQKLGFFTEKRQLKTDVIQKSRLQKIYYRWFDESITILERKGFLQYDGTTYTTVDPTMVDTDELWKKWENIKKMVIEKPEIKASVHILEAVLSELPDILTGKRLATDVLFPNGSIELMEDLYKSNPVIHYFNCILATFLVSFIQERLKQDPSAKIRILEIGAGTGGTSAVIFPELIPFKENVQEYCYTDVSKAFLSHAKKEYAPQNQYLTYKIFDIEKPIAAQGLDAGGYDVVLATNVIHATKDIRKTLRNVKTILSSGGVLLLNQLQLFSGAPLLRDFGGMVDIRRSCASNSWLSWAFSRVLAKSVGNRRVRICLFSGQGTS
jgi:2-polyprenyl-3-methyl-5-hydroxy-6-metoxy-1,4-benzoquinol methylase